MLRFDTKYNHTEDLREKGLRRCFRVQMVYQSVIRKPPAKGHEEMRIPINTLRTLGKQDLVAVDIYLRHSACST
jgi:hypothetical protein